MYNFKTAGTIIEESQAKALQNYWDSLRSNRHRKMMNKMVKETIRQQGGDVMKGRADVIKTLRNVPNKDQTFAFLIRNNKLMNKNGVRFSAENGKINLNGVPIDVNSFNTMERSEMGIFFKTLPNTPEPNQVEIASTTTMLKNVFKVKFKKHTLLKLGIEVTKLCQNVPKYVCEYIMDIVNEFAFDLFQLEGSNWSEVLDKLFPHQEKYFALFKMVTNYLQNLVNVVEDCYQMWLKNKELQVPTEFLEYNTKSASKRAIQILEYMIKVYNSKSAKEALMKELSKYLYHWVSKKCCENSKQEQEQKGDEERKTKRREHCSDRPNVKVLCSKCEGFKYEVTG